MNTNEKTCKKTMRGIMTGIFFVLLACVTLLSENYAEAKINKNADYVHVTAKWRKVQGKYFSFGEKGLRCKDSKNGKAKTIANADIYNVYTNGYYIYAFGQNGKFNRCIFKFRLAAKKERQQGKDNGLGDGYKKCGFVQEGKIKKYENDYFYNADEFGDSPITKDSKFRRFFRNNKFYFVCVGGDCLAEQEFYVVVLNLKNGKDKKYAIGGGGDGSIRLTKNYIYGTTAGGDAAGKPLYVFDIKKCKVRQIQAVWSYRIKNKQLYCTIQKYQKGKSFYRTVRYTLGGRKVKAVTKWKKGYPKVYV